jgi:hypothetical protein
MSANTCGVLGFFLRLLLARAVCLEAAFGAKEDVQQELVDTPDEIGVEFPPFVVNEEGRTVSMETCKKIWSADSTVRLKVETVPRDTETGSEKTAHDIAEMCRKGFSHTQSSKRAAVILRGEGFRNFGSQHTSGTCCDIGHQAQKEIYESHKKMFEGIKKDLGR